MNIIFISPNYPAGHWRYVSALCEAGHTVLGIGDAGEETFPPILRGCLTEYYRVGDLHDYESVYRACGYFIGRYGRIGAIESLNPYWCDLIYALSDDAILSGGTDAQYYYPLYAGLCSAQTQLLSPRATASSNREAKGFCEENGFPVLAVPMNNKRLGRHILRDEKELRTLLGSAPKDEYMLCALFTEERISVDGLCLYTGEQDDDGYPWLTMTACTAHVMTGDGCASASPLSEQEIDKIRQLVTQADRPGFFHIDACRVAKAIPGKAKRGELILCDYAPAPPHEYIIDCMNIELDCDLRVMWARGFAPAREEDITHDDAAQNNAIYNDTMQNSEIQNDTTQSDVIDSNSADKPPVYPLAMTKYAAAVSRSFERSYKNPHEKAARRLGITLRHHSRTSDSDRAAWGDYIYIFCADTPAKLRGSIKFITEDFTQCK